MSEGVALSEAPSRFLNTEKWAELRSFANNELIALTSINAFYPEEREGLHALRRYQLGRALLEECRCLLLQGKLIATRSMPNGKRITIPAGAWINLWPLFATGRANGRGVIFEQIEIHAANAFKLERDCIAWLTSHSEVVTQKKATVHYEASLALGKKLSHAIFNSAYKHVFGRKRGRPRKSLTH